MMISPKSDKSSDVRGRTVTCQRNCQSSAADTGEIRLHSGLAAGHRNRVLIRPEPFDRT